LVIVDTNLVFENQIIQSMQKKINIDTYVKLVCKNGFSHLRLALIINFWITLGLSSLDLVALYHIHKQR
jgi:hypothetical protein